MRLRKQYGYGKPIFALCVKNDDCDDIEVRKIYKMIPDKRASQEGYIRIVDESGEDYLYPESYFLIIDLPLNAQELLFAA
ncbi:MAG: hypothetical protein MUF15_18035 [Acidobacteria bacterium]|nr:hypothetical protein [Acidobacteriota bacterium]